MDSHMLFGSGVLGAGISFLLVLSVWSLFWKGLALWHSARRGEYWWFLAMLVLNTVGILEIVYLFAFSGLRLDTLFTMDGKKKEQGASQPDAQ